MKRILLCLANSFIETDVRKKIRKEITRETKKMMDKGETPKGKIPTSLNISETIENEVLNKKMAQILKNDLLLHEAVIKNEAESVARVLKEDVDVDSRNNYGRAPIHWAASRGNTEIIEMLIQAKCDIEAKDKYGMRPLHMAAWYGHQDAVKVLINAGANVSAVNKEKESCFLSFYLCLSQKQYTLLMCGARGNNVNVVQYLAEAVESLNGDAMDYTGATALHHAAVAGHPGVISAICNIPRIELNATDKIGQAPIHRACSEEHLGAVAALVDLGANVNAQDNEGNTPLHVATRMRQIEMVQLLLKAGANTELTDQMDFTPLHLAASHGCKGILDLLIQNGATLNKECKNGNTALHLACQNNEVDTVEILINKGVDLNFLNLRMQSPIHIAAEMGHTEICELLLASGANIEQREQSGRTPLYIAARGSFTAIVDMIIKTARLDYPTPENSNSDKEVRELTPARRRWREGSRGGSVCSNNSALTESIRSVLWKLAYKQLGPEDWKKLALHWAFSHEQIKAIEHQYTGPSSYKEHGFRMLMIWTSGLNSEAPLVKELCEALQAIDKKNLADSIRKQTNLENEVKLKSNKQSCHECLIV
ncbi:ankyrin repeat and death domain-containing protein 1A-like isoform X2 [Vespa crabro]|uniref:ankyrin repeat and death domain-containing protein 1A-like isoform X2 n=1 Tax=Vespa crabro TaxID=7445 RepID=UPI001F032874|nr:ankyrin repeat and death domain-containing protein 1A-like isoform X2 [Vespa crabro]